MKNTIKLLSWNVNGIRAISAKDDWAWFKNSEADIIGLQETKASQEQLADDIKNPENWQSYFCSSQLRKGYSGVAVYSKLPVINHSYELTDYGLLSKYLKEATEFEPNGLNKEGRVIHLEYEKFHYFNIYFPNGGDNNKRVAFKLAFYDAFLEQAEKLRKDKPIVVCGDFNTAHKEIDLTHPKSNEKTTGFLPVEREWLDKFVAHGYIDTFRFMNGDEPENYTWWSYRMQARAKNVGWRIDYFFISEELKPYLKNAWIEHDIYGSDHCPIGIELEL